jgi:hypothetical protein
MDVGVGIILYLWVALVPDPYRDEFGRRFNFTPDGCLKKVQQYFSPITPVIQPS